MRGMRRRRKRRMRPVYPKDGDRFLDKPLHTSHHTTFEQCSLVCPQNLWPIQA